MNQVSPGNLRATFSAVQLLGILLTRESWSHRVAASGVTPIGYVSFAAPCGDTGFTWRGYQIGRERLAYSRQSLDTDFITVDGEDHWVMLIPETLLDDFLGQELAADLLREASYILCDPRLIGQLSCLVTDTIALLEANDACQADHHVLVALRNQLLVATTRILLNNTSAQLDQGQATRRFLACRRARHAIEANTSYSSMEELAKEVGVSRRSLEVAFRESTGMSPQLFCALCASECPASQPVETHRRLRCLSHRLSRTWALLSLDAQRVITASYSTNYLLRHCTVRHR